ncbi:unnamed protein product [Clavelina lepadiformis]|uniref:FYVE-type domain-containing protein n=1 Tax=Clavelina lepadiformis TaxID=159417 RepID=A0ABP0F8A5_CLALP
MESGSGIREGFLCPICVQDLGSFHKLQNHFESFHTAEDKAVFDQIKGLFSKAKGALLRREVDIDGRNSNPSSFQHSPNVTVPEWEPQEFGATRSHLEKFKKIRDARIDRFVIESNKVLIRLDKLLSHVRLTGRGNKKEFEQSLVPWVKDGDVPFCPTCGDRFNVARRRHHCRLCGAIMCTKCSLYIPFELADIVVQTLKKATISQLRTRSLLNVSTLPQSESELKIRCCHECYKVLLKRKDKIEQQFNQPILVMLYERLRTATDAATRHAPEYERMADSLNIGEEDYDLNSASDMRFKMIKLYETIDVLSKKIAALNTKDEEKPPTRGEMRLQNAIRIASHIYLQENMLTLQSLPSLPKLEMLQKARRKEKERKLRQQIEEAERERAEAKRVQELQRLQKEREIVENKKSMYTSESPSVTSAQPLVLSDGWTSDYPIDKLTIRKKKEYAADERDPILEQIQYVEQMMAQAQASARFEEMESLNNNLKELKNEYRRQNARNPIMSDNRNSKKLSKTQPSGKYQNQGKSKLLVNTNPFLQSEESGSRTSTFAIEQPTTSKNPFLEDEKSNGKDDPMLQQICYISKCLDEAIRLGKNDEVAILRENLQQLQKLYNRK